MDDCVGEIRMVRGVPVRRDPQRGRRGHRSAGIATRRGVEVSEDLAPHGGRHRVGEHVAHAVEPGVRGIRDQRGEPPPVLDRHEVVMGAVHHERRDGRA